MRVTLWESNALRETKVGEILTLQDVMTNEFKGNFFFKKYLTKF